MGRLITNDLPIGKKVDIRAQIDLTKEVPHSATIEIGLECAGEMTVVDSQGPFYVHFIIIMFFFLRLVTHSSQYTAATDLIEIRNALT